MSSSPHAHLIRDLEAAHASGGAPVLGHASPFQWAAACHELLEADCADHMHVLEYAARHLNAAYPGLAYLATLVAWFDAVPRDLPPPLAFRDTPAAEIQVVARADCDAVLLCFCARQGTLGVPLNFGHQWLGRLPASLIYIKDFRNLFGGCGYPSLGPDRATAIAALRSLADGLGAKRIYTLGVSQGGYPALYYGLELGAHAVLSLAGATDMTPDFVESLGPARPNYFDLLQLAPDYAKNLRTSFASADPRPHVLLAFSGDNSRDRRKAERMSGLPNVELIAVDGYAQHNVVDPLIQRGEFFDLLNRLLSFPRRCRSTKLDH
jgi:hypothetical protein